MIITLCGSTRFVEAFALAQLDLSMRGHIVLSVACFGHADIPAGAKHLTADGDMEAESKQQLDNLHLRKILMSDAIMVINPGSYIGKSTSNEIMYARSAGKQVFYMFGNFNANT